MKSLGKKMDNARYGYGTQPASRSKPGAFGKEAVPPGSRRKAGTSATREGKAAALRRIRSR